LALAEFRQQAETIVAHSLTIEIAPGVETRLVRLEGELDLANAHTLTEELLRLLDTRLQRLVVDLDGLEFIDSSGLHSLLRVMERSNADGDRLRIIEPRGQVSRLFKLTNLDTVLPIVSR
jgi:anti-sigma B factor antagonist